MRCQDPRERYLARGGRDRRRFLPGRYTGLQAHAQVTQDMQHFADLRGILSLFDFRNPRLAAAHRLGQSRLRQALVTPRGHDNLTYLNGRLSPHKQPYSRSDMVQYIFDGR